MRTYRKMLAILILMFTIAAMTTTVRADTSIGAFEKRASMPSTDRIVAIQPSGADEVYVVTYSGQLFLYNEKSNHWKELTGHSMTAASSMAKLPDGRLLIIGVELKGQDGYHHNVVYNPKTGQFKQAADLPMFILNQPTISATVLQNGRVLMMGEYTLYSSPVALAYLYDESRNEWTEPFRIQAAAASIEQDANGNVLNYGGGLGDSFVVGNYYNAETGKVVQTARVPYVLTDSATVALKDGSFLLIGGNTALSVISPSNKVLRYNPAKNEWRDLKGMQTARVRADAIELPDGRVLVVGGYVSRNGLKSTELYNPQTHTWTAGPNLHAEHEMPFIVQLGNGKLFVVSSSSTSDPTAVEVLSLKQSDSQWQPSFDEEQAMELKKLVKGIIIKNDVLFTKDEWTYRIAYTYDKSVNFRFSTDDISYTNSYLIRVNEKTKNVDVVLEGNIDFVKLDGDIMYYIENGYLKKLQLGNVFGESILYPKSFKMQNPKAQWSLLGHWDLKANKPVQAQLHGFDGEFIYTWYDNRFPVKLHYTGQYIEPLSAVMANRYTGMQLQNDWIVYTGIISSGIDTALITVKTDGSAQHVLTNRAAFVNVIGERVYYIDKAAAKGGLSNQGILTSSKLDGSDKKRLFNEPIYGGKYTERGMVIYSEQQNALLLVSYDGQVKEKIAKASPSEVLSIVDANEYRVVYSKGRIGYEWNTPTYLYSFATKQTIVYNGHYSDRIKAVLNGDLLNFDQDPVIRNGRTLAPIRQIFEALGAEIEWQREINTVVAKKDGAIIQLKIGQQHAFVNGQRVQLAQAPIIENGRTLVPLRFIAEAFGAYVTWVSEENTAYIMMDM